MSSKNVSGKHKVAIVIGQLTMGGAEKQATYLAKGLANTKGFIPIVFCTSNLTDPFGPYLRAEGIEVHSVSSPRYSKLRKIIWLKSTMQKAGCDLVYGLLHVGNIYGGLVAKSNGTAFVASIRNTDKSIGDLTKYFSSFFCSQADMVIANSISCANFLDDGMKVRHGRVRIVSNAIHPQNRKIENRIRFRKLWNIPDDAMLIGTVALLKKQKRPGFAIRTFVKILEHENKISEKPMHFIWLGEGLLREEVNRILGSLPDSVADRFHFPGDHFEIEHSLPSFDVFVLTSACEGMPNALLEAMAMGLPCVATDVEGTRDVFFAANGYGEIGILADPDDPEKFAESLMEVLGQPDRMKRMAKNAQEYVLSEYSSGKMVKSHCEVFEEVLRGRRLR